MIISADNLIFPCGMSRSGTTLLATLFDSHSSISMCYELIPPKFESLKRLLEILIFGLNNCDNKLENCGLFLKENLYSTEGVFFTRCYRAGIDAKDLINILNKLIQANFRSIDGFEDRLKLAWLISKRSAVKRNKLRYGFKLNIPSVENAHRCFINSKFVYIVRDPRDVVSSHFHRNFNRTIFDICNAWNNYSSLFLAFLEKFSASGLIVRYEDIVTDSVRVLPSIFNFLELKMETSVFEFYNSKAGVHIYGHPNSKNLKKDFFNTSVGRWKNELNLNQIKEIQDLCCQQMFKFGYEL